MKTVQDIMAENNSIANIERFQTMQKWDHKRKVAHAQEMAEAFYYWAKETGKGVHLSVGGLDSITLHYFLESIGLPVTCVSCSSLEGKGVQEVHKRIAQEMSEEYKDWMGDSEKPEFVFLKPLKSKVQVLQECGWPVISKEKAGKIALLQNPTEKNATVRHAIITGETGEYGGYQKNSRMKLPQKWLDLFGGADAEGAALGYKAAPFKVSDRCCYYLKEKPCNDWAKGHDSVPYMGLMASEGGATRKKSENARMQLLRQNNDQKRTLCNFRPTGYFAVGDRLERPSPGGIWRDCKNTGRKTVYHKGAAHRLHDVRVWHSCRAAPTSVRCASPAKPKRMGVLDEARMPGRRRKLIRMGPSSGLHWYRVGGYPGKARANDRG